MASGRYKKKGTHQSACRHEWPEKPHVRISAVRSWDRSSGRGRLVHGAGTIDLEMIKGFIRLTAVLGVGALSITVLAGQSRPLPDRDEFLRETRKHLQTDSTVQSSYVYVETRRELKLDKDGRTEEESVKVGESYPGLHS